MLFRSNINQGQADVIEEFVIDGKREIHVTTPSGLEYYIKDDAASAPLGGPVSEPVRAPRWVIRTF